MAYFKWIGVDIAGKMKKGKLSAHSWQSLDTRLFRQGIALISCKKKYIPLLSRAISIQKKGDLFAYVAKLMQAGIVLPTALEMAAQQSTNPLLQDIFFTFSNDLQCGVPFFEALNRHKKITNTLITTMLIAGHEVGDLAKAFEFCALYCKKQGTLEKNIRALLAIPLLTFLFFVAMSTFIFTTIIPRFAEMFSSLQHELPPLTQRMISISNFLRSGAILWIIAIILVTTLLIRYYSKRQLKKICDYIVIKLPFIGSVLYQHHIQQTLYALSLLTYNGIPATKALALVAQLETNLSIKKELIQLHENVSSGQLISDAMMISGIFLPDTIALVHIGEESGTVGQSLEYAAELYRDSLETSVRRLTLLIQPVIIILLGLLITLVIFSVYLPIMELSRVV